MTKMFGKDVSEKIIEDCKKRLRYFHNRTKVLVIITLGEDEASKIYVRNKIRKAEELGFTAMHVKFSDTCTYNTLYRFVELLNEDTHVKGIIIQKPLPSHLASWEDKIDNLIAPKKDIDGFGILSEHDPCTPKGIMTMLDFYKVPVERKNVVIAGRSKIVAKPLAKMFMDRDCTVTMIHSKTPRDTVKALLKNCDIFVSAIGKPHYWTSDYFKDTPKKLALVDVGINRLDEKVVGDINPDCYEHFEFYTPVPGGVGVVTVATLMENLVDSI